MAFTVPGYPAAVWAACKAALAPVAAASPSDPAAMLAALAKAAATVRNARHALAAWQMQGALAQAYSDLEPVLSLPLSLDAATRAFLSARLSAIQSASLALPALLPVPARDSVGDPLYLEWLMGFALEAPPPAMDPSALAATADAAATAWSTAATAVATQGVSGSAATHDACLAMAAASSRAAAHVAACSSAQQGSVAAWNGVVAVPSILRYGASRLNDPTSGAAQQVAVMRYLLGSLQSSLAVAAASLAPAAPPVLRTATVLVGDTLMDIAARALGDFTRWREIAAANGLVPPYVSDAGGSNVAAPGQSVILPSGAGTAAAQPPPDYPSAFLGTDTYYGGMNQEMLPWGGDFAAISGYANLALSLGRRLQTRLGGFVFHSDFGSLIPAEVGAVTNEATAGHVRAYAASALLSDPRVESLTDVRLSILPSYGLGVRAVVQPKGAPQGTAVPVEAVLSPAPSVRLPSAQDYVTDGSGGLVTDGANQAITG